MNGILNALGGASIKNKVLTGILAFALPALFVAGMVLNDKVSQLAKDESIFNFLLQLGVILTLVIALAAYMVADYLAKRINSVSLMLDNSPELGLADQVPDEIGSLVNGVNGLVKKERAHAQVSAEVAVKAQKAADESASLRKAIKNLPTPVVHVDLEGNFVNLNSEANDTRGLNLQQYKSLCLNEANLPYSEVVNASGQEFTLQISPLFDSNNKFSGAVVNWQASQAAGASGQEEILHEVRAKLNENVQMLNQAFSNLEYNSSGLASSINEMSAYANEVHQHSNSVTISADELTSSISEIASNTDKASSMTSEAVSMINRTTEVIENLKQRSDEIESILKTVTEIANQTNLLALNATIEAARAGDAGKGFAVVANEVKDLAQRTAESTQDIAEKIKAIQTETATALTSVENASSRITSINDITVTIASAIEEQTAVTSEIGHSVKTSTDKVNMMINNVTKVGELVDNNSKELVGLTGVSSKLIEIAN